MIDFQDLENNETDWVANMATGYARTLHRWAKGQEYADAVDFADGLEPRPVLSDQQALLSARKLRLAADILTRRIEAQIEEASSDGR